MRPTIMMIGPTVVPDRVLKAMQKNMVSHRAEEYHQIHREVCGNLQKIFHTKNPVYTLTASATGAMEATLENCFNPGDEVVIPIIGTFSEQFAKQADVFGLKVTRVPFELGESADVAKVVEHVTENTRGVFVIHNESATGVTNNLEKFGQALKGSNALLVSDTVSGFAGIPTYMDDWGIDVFLTGSQKALMSPAGMSFITLSEKAKEATKSCKQARYYFNLSHFDEFSIKGETPNTPAIFGMLAVREALRMITEEGIDSVYERHNLCHQKLKAGIECLGYNLLADDEAVQSKTVNAIVAKGQAKRIVKRLKDRNVIINTALGKLSEDVFRVGTMGYVFEKDVDTFLNEFEYVIKH